MTSDPVTVALTVTTCLFAVFTGANDGGSLLAASMRTSSVRPLAAVLILSAAVAAGPVLFGTQVATTLADRLVQFGGPEATPLLLVAVGTATAVVVVLSRRGIATSLTLALVGAILGSGFGAGRPVAWDWAVLVLVLAAVAPVVGLAGAVAVSRFLARRRSRGSVADRVRRLHRLGFVAQAFAYGANDGQKMLAVVSLAAAAGATGSAGSTGSAAPTTGDVTAGPAALLGISALFALGALLGLRRYGTRMGTAVYSATPVNAVAAQLSSVTAVLGSAAAGVPVSMTQVAAGALVGSGLADRSRRVRWNQVVAILMTWALTLPVAGLVASLAAAIAVRW